MSIVQPVDESGYPLQPCHRGALDGAAQEASASTDRAWPSDGSKDRGQRKITIQSKEISQAQTLMRMTCQTKQA